MPPANAAEAQPTEEQKAAAEAVAKAIAEAAEAETAAEAAAEAEEAAAKAAAEAEEAAAKAAAEAEDPKGKKNDLETRIRKAKGGEKIKLPSNSGIIASASARYMVDPTTKVRYEANFAIPCESLAGGSWLHSQVVAGILLVTALADVKG
jgi:hypothetical protein